MGALIRMTRMHAQHRVSFSAIVKDRADCLARSELGNLVRPSNQQMPIVQNLVRLRLDHDIKARLMRCQGSEELGLAHVNRGHAGNSRVRHGVGMTHRCQPTASLLEHRRATAPQTCRYYCTIRSRQTPWITHNPQHQGRKTEKKPSYAGWQCRTDQ